MTRWPRSRHSARQSANSGLSALRTAVPVAGKKISKQPLLRGAIRLHVAMVVEVVAGEVGERRRGDHDAVETELREAMARRLERDMVDAALRQLAEIAVEGNRVGGGQCPRAAPGRRYHAESAEARRRAAEGGPDLAREMCDRGLAVGAGDRGDRPRLAPVEARGEQARRRCGLASSMIATRRRAASSSSKPGSLVGQDRHRAVRDRLRRQRRVRPAACRAAPRTENPA